MASRALSGLGGICSSGYRTIASAGSRAIGTKPVPIRKGSNAPFYLLGGSVIGGAVGYKVYQHYKGSRILPELEECGFLRPAVVNAASFPASQPSVFSPGKAHALYLWIYAKPGADARQVAKAVAKLQKYVDEVTDPKLRDETDEIWAGVGFGPNFYSQISGKTKKNYNYPHRKGGLGDMPSSGGDVFIHAKCDTFSKLFELSQKIMKNLPAECVESFEDIYSFVFQNGRDLSGFIDGTENPADDESRQNVAVEKETGGSYVITQKWVHQHKVISTEKDKTKEGWVGRTLPDSTELSRKTVTSHVTRMTGGQAFNQKKVFEIVRQSMPYGTVSGDSGLFFIGYAASPENFEFMLDRMVGAGGDGQGDDIMRLTQNIKGTYWYFPGVAELKKLE